MHTHSTAELARGIQLAHNAPRESDMRISDGSRQRVTVDNEGGQRNHRDELPARDSLPERHAAFARSGHDECGLCRAIASLHIGARALDARDRVGLELWAGDDFEDERELRAIRAAMAGHGETVTPNGRAGECGT